MERHTPCCRLPKQPTDINGRNFVHHQLSQILFKELPTKLTTVSVWDEKTRIECDSIWEFIQTDVTYFPSDLWRMPLATRELPGGVDSSRTFRTETLSISVLSMQLSNNSQTLDVVFKSKAATRAAHKFTRLADYVSGDCFTFVFTISFTWP